jgi:hypothetical protein
MFRKQLNLALYIILSLFISSHSALSQNNEQLYAWEEPLELKINHLLSASNSEKKLHALKEIIRFLKTQTGNDTEERILLSSLTKGFQILPQSKPDQKQCKSTKLHLEYSFMGANDNGELKPYTVEIVEKVLDSICNSN